MNIFLWILQILLALWNVAGGVYTLSNYEKLKGPLADNLPQAVWVAIGVLQIVFALGLVLPGLVGASPKIISVAALYLAANALLGCVLFAQYAGFPGLLWGVIPALLAVFIAYASG